MASKKSCLHLPLDEIRNISGAAHAANVGNIKTQALISGNPKIINDPTMGTCMRFDGQDDYIELSNPKALTFKRGMTGMAWVRFSGTPSFSRIFDVNVTENSNKKIVWAGNTFSSKDLAFEVDGVRFLVTDGIKIRQWQHLAFTYEPDGKISILLDGEAVTTKEVRFDIASTDWKTGYIGKSSYAVDSLFQGDMSHFRLYNEALTHDEIKEVMLADKNAASLHRETTLLKVDLYTVHEDDHKPILFVEADNKSEPLQMRLTNPTNKPVKFIKIDTPTEDDFHVQLRFRRNVIAPDLLRDLKAGKTNIAGWDYVAGTTEDGREDYLSFVSSDEPAPTLNKSESWRVEIAKFRAAAQGGARNTRVQVRYRTQPQDPGSVIRHMEVQSHLGLKTIPLIARFTGSNTILNNGQTENELQLEVICIQKEASIKLDTDSRFELIVDRDLSNQPIQAHSQTDWLKTNAQTDGGVHTEAIPLVVTGKGGEITPENPIRIDLSRWVTAKTSGMYNIVLRYEGIPGYWDGAWVLPVQFSPLLLRNDRIGIGTDTPAVELDVHGNAHISKRLGIGIEDPQKELDVVGSAQISGNLDMASAQITDDLEVGGQLQAKANANIDGTLDVGQKVTVGGDLEVAKGVHSKGRIRDQSGFVMPVGAILPYGGQTAPSGWLLCDGQSIVNNVNYQELRDVVGNNVPNLRGQFVLGADPSRPKLKHGQSHGEETVTLSEGQIPKHTHKFDGSPYYVHKRSFDGNDKGGKTLKYNSGDGYTRKLEGVQQNEKGGGSHNNMPPYYALTYIIKY